MKPVYQCAKIVQSLQHNQRPLFALDLFRFYSRAGIYYFTCQKQQNI